MRKIINHLRSKPEEVRRHILHLITLGFAVILIALWVYSLGTTLSKDNKTSETLKPFSALKDNIVDGYNSISNDNPFNQDNTAQ